MSEIVDSDRIYLRQLEENDITDEYVSWHDNKEHIKYYSSSGKKFTRDFIVNEILEGQKNEDLFVYGIFVKENDKLIGNVRIGPVSQRHKTSDLIVFIGDTEYLGKGLAVEAIRAGNQVAFKNHDIRKLFGGMYRGNIGSVKAYTRADWIIEGVLLGQYLMDGKAENRILVACFNPEYFNVDEIKRNSLSIEDVYQS